jgi:hypothetical protein
MKLTRGSLAVLAIMAAFSPSAASAVTFTISGDLDPTTTFTIPQNPIPTSFDLGNDFGIAPDNQVTNGVPVSLSYYFYSDAALGGLSDSFGYYNLFGPQLYTGPESSPTFTAGTFTFYNGNNGNADTVTVSVPELSTWAMMLAGFAGLSFVTTRRKLQAA